MDISNLKCKMCHTPIKKEDVRLEWEYAICSACGTVFGPGAKYAQGHLPEINQARKFAALNGVRITNETGELVITCDWISTKSLAILWGVVWTGVFSIPILLMFFVVEDIIVPIIMLSPFAIALLIILYRAACILINSTLLHVAQGSLTVQHGPLPWFGNLNLKTNSIDQVYVKENVAYYQNNQPHYAYQLIARFDSHTDITLLNMRDPHPLRHIARELREYLNLQEQPIAAEYKAQQFNLISEGQSKNLQELEALTCPTCGAPGQAEDIHPDLQYVMCAYCGKAFGPGATRAAQEPVRKPLNLPKGIQMNIDASGLTLRYRWFKPKILLLILLTTIFALPLIFFIGMSLYELSLGINPFEDITPLEASVLIIIGGAYLLAVSLLANTVLVGLFNTTIIHITREQMTIRDTPVPQLRNRTIEAKSLEQIYVKTRSYGDRGELYTVRARLDDGSDFCLLSGFETPDVALYIEQEIERYLGIQDRRMPEEYIR